MPDEVEEYWTLVRPVRLPPTTAPIVDVTALNRDCPRCGGSGQEPTPFADDYELRYDPDGSPESPPACKDCEGHGVSREEMMIDLEVRWHLTF
jgi:DnaJ-class molecular chaperone